MAGARTAPGSAEPARPDKRGRAVYRRALQVLLEHRVPFLIGGAFALQCYTGVCRNTKDLDVFVHPRDFDRVQQVLAAAGFETEVRFPHWLGKAYCGEHFVDIIFSSGNGICAVDDAWFEHATTAKLFEHEVRLLPVEEMVWSKAFIMERERYDGADIAHLLLTCSERLDWGRLLDRFGPYWRVLLSHLVLFGFIYPSKRDRVPGWVMTTLLRRLEEEMRSPPPSGELCQGTLLSWSQYLPEIERQGFQDARVMPHGSLSKRETARVTETMKRATETMKPTMKKEEQ